jgi:hypothetical protein
MLTVHGDSPIRPSSCLHSLHDSGCTRLSSTSLFSTHLQSYKIHHVTRSNGETKRTSSRLDALVLCWLAPPWTMSSLMAIGLTKPFSTHFTGCQLKRIRTSLRPRRQQVQMRMRLNTIDRLRETQIRNTTVIMMTKTRISSHQRLYQIVQSIQLGFHMWNLYENTTHPPKHACKLCT